MVLPPHPDSQYFFLTARNVFVFSLFEFTVSRSSKGGLTGAKTLPGGATGGKTVPHTQAQFIQQQLLHQQQRRQQHHQRRQAASPAIGATAAPASTTRSQSPLMLSPAPTLAVAAGGGGGGLTLSPAGGGVVPTNTLTLPGQPRAQVQLSNTLATPVDKNRQSVFGYQAAMVRTTTILLCMWS